MSSNLKSDYLTMSSFTYILGLSVELYVIKVCQLLAAGQWLFPGTPVSPTNKTDLNDVTEMLLKVVLNKITVTQICEMVQF